MVIDLPCTLRIACPAATSLCIPEALKVPLVLTIEASNAER